MVPLATAALCFLLVGSSVLAQDGAAINWWVFGGGGAVTVNDMLDQAVIGASGSDDVVLGAEYWYDEVEDIESPELIPPEPIDGHTEPVNTLGLSDLPMFLVLAVSAGLL